MNQNPIFPVGLRYRPASLKSGVFPLTWTVDPVEPVVGWTLTPYASGRGGVGHRPPGGGGEPTARKATCWIVAGRVGVGDTAGLPLHETAVTHRTATDSARTLIEEKTGRRCEWLRAGRSGSGLPGGHNVHAPPARGLVLVPNRYLRPSSGCRVARTQSAPPGVPPVSRCTFPFMANGFDGLWHWEGTYTFD